MTEFAALRLHLVTDGVEEAAAGVRDVGHAAEEASGGVHVLDEAMDKLVERFALWRAFDQVLDWMKEFARDGLEAARAMQLLNNQLELTAPGMTYLQDSAKDAIEQVSGLGESTDKDLTTALQRLILITGDAAWSIQHLQTAQDIAAATGMDLVTSATDLGRAYNGVWIQLERLGLVTKEQVESGGAMDALIQKTQDMTAAANEGAGAWHKLGIEIANAAERAAAGLEKGSGPLASFLSRFLLEKIPEGPGIDPLKFLFPGLLGPNPGTGPSPGGAFPGLSGSTAGGADTLGSPAWWAAQQSAAFLQIGTTFTPEQIKATAALQAKAAAAAARAASSTAAAAARAAAEDAAEHPYLGPGYGTPDLASQLTEGGVPLFRDPPQTARLFTQQQTSLGGLGPDATRRQGQGLRHQWAKWRRPRRTPTNSRRSISNSRATSPRCGSGWPRTLSGRSRARSPATSSRPSSVTWARTCSRASAR